MKIKKNLLRLVGLMIVVIILGTLYDKISRVDNKEVIKEYNNLISNEGIEHVIIEKANRFTSDIYRDKILGKERVDYYDENGLLVNRTITTDFGASFFKLSQYIDENGEWAYNLSKIITPKGLHDENEKYLKMSIINAYIEDQLASGDYLKWKKSTDKDNITKYTVKNQKIHVDSYAKKISTKEFLSSGKVTKLSTVEIVDNNKKNDMDLFKIDTPLLKEDSIAINKSIKTITKDLKLEINDNSDVYYDPNNSHG